MARIEIDPNYSSPTFSRATAGTDLFKKEDVQALAAAVSTHDHTTGKGAVLAAGSIPTGSITSAMIADGTIVAGDLADGAVTNPKLADGAVSNVKLQDATIANAKLQDATIQGGKIAAGTVGRSNIAANAVSLGYVTQYTLTASTTSTSPVIIPSTVLTFVTGGVQLISWALPIYTNATVGIYVYLFVDSSVSGPPLAYVNMTAAQGTVNFSGSTMTTALSPGSHRFELGWQVGGSGTATLNGAAAAYLTVMDLAR